MRVESGCDMSVLLHRVRDVSADAAVSRGDGPAPWRVCPLACSFWQAQGRSSSVLRPHAARSSLVPMRVERGSDMSVLPRRVRDVSVDAAVSRSDGLAPWRAWPLACCF